MVLGGVEISSIATGYEVLDAIVKVAPVSTLSAESVCPGKFLIFFTGDVASVESSVAAGKEKAASFLVDYLLIPNLHSDVETFFQGGKGDIDVEAVGFIESYTAISAVRAADAACKVSEVRLVRMKLAHDIGGKSFFVISGSVEAVETAVVTAASVEREKGFLCREVVIPRPHPEILDYLG